MAAQVSFLGYRVSDSVTYVVWSLMASAILISQIQSSPICLDGYYYDDVTGNCDHCSDICENAKEQRTVDKCLELCPDFQKKSQKCPHLEYYDSVVGRCDTCSSICPESNDYDSDKLSSCREMCPDWSTLSSSQEHGNGSKNGTTPKSDSHTSVIIAIVVPLMTAVIILVFLLGWMYHTSRTQKTIERVCNKRPQQRVQMDSNERELLTAGGEPLAHPEDEDG